MLPVPMVPRATGGVAVRARAGPKTANCPTFMWVGPSCEKGRPRTQLLAGRAVPSDGFWVDSVHVHVTQKHVKWFTPARAQLKERRSRAYGHAIAHNSYYQLRPHPTQLVVQ